MAASLQLKDFSDLELLRRIQDVVDKSRDANGGGFVRAEDVSKVLGLDHPNPVQCVRARFSWLKRYGILEKNDVGEWRITPAGCTALDARLNKAVTTGYEKMNDGQRVALTNLLSTGYASVDTASANLMRRTWAFNGANRTRR